MESTASRSFLLPPCPASLCFCKPEIARNVNMLLPSLFSVTLKLPSSSKFGKPLRFPLPPCSSSPIEGSNPLQDLGILLEVEGVLADAHRAGNRQAFNVAFQKLGLDCANWTEPIYADLLRKSNGDETKMLSLFFNRIGWPSSLPTTEIESFTRHVLREKLKALEDFAASSGLTLRPGVEKFIEEALQEDIPVVLLTVHNKQGNTICRHIIEKLGKDITSKLIIVGEAEVKGSLYGQLVLGKGGSLRLDEQLAKEARKAVSLEKQKIAEEVASSLKLTVELDSSPSESSEMILASLRAGAELTNLPVDSCILIAGSQSGVLGAERIGMPCIVLRSSLTARAEFRAAKVVMDGFGGADLSISKLRSRRWY